MRKKVYNVVFEHSSSKGKINSSTLDQRGTILRFAVCYVSCTRLCLFFS